MAGQWIKIGSLKEPRSRDSRAEYTGKIMAVPTHPKWDGRVVLFKHKPGKNEKYPPEFDIFAVVNEEEQGNSGGREDSRGRERGRRSRRDDRDSEESKGDDDGDDFDEGPPFEVYENEEEGQRGKVDPPKQEPPKDERFTCAKCGEAIGPKCKRCPADLPDCPTDFQRGTPF